MIAAETLKTLDALLDDSECVVTLGNGMNVGSGGNISSLRFVLLGLSLLAGTGEAVLNDRKLCSVGVGLLTSCAFLGSAKDASGNWVCIVGASRVPFR